MPMLIIRVYFELTQPIRLRYINVTDRQTDGRTTSDSNTALCTTSIARHKPLVQSSKSVNAVIEMQIPNDHASARIKYCDVY